MFDAAKLLAAVNKSRRWRSSELANPPVENVGGGLFDGALRLLLRVGAWRRVPERTAQRMLALQHWRREHDSSLWLATERRYALVGRIASYLQRLQPQLAQTEYTGVPLCASANTLYIYCATRIAKRNDARSAAALPLYSLLLPLAYDANDDRALFELLAFRRVVLYDVHVLDRESLLRVLALLDAAHAVGALEVVLAGDARLKSTLFAEIVGASCFRRAELGVDDAALDARAVVRPMHDEYDTLFVGVPAKKPDPVAALRRACRLAVHTSADREQLIREILQTSDPRALEHALRDDGGMSRYRWLLACGTFKEAAESVYTALRDASARCHAEAWAADVTRHFALLCERPQRAAEFLFIISPYVGYLNQCARVLNLYMLERPPLSGDVLAESACALLRVGRSSPVQVVSLDCALLVLELEPEQFAINHTVCCGTWAPNVMRAARHRTELCAQSFVLARDALPLGSRDGTSKRPHTTCALFGANYRFDDVYAIYSHASPARHQRFLTFGANADALRAALDKRYAAPRTFLADLLATD
jgi:hypothetical protein